MICYWATQHASKLTRSYEHIFSFLKEYKEVAMQQQTSAVRAALDIGSNTIEVLVARCLPGGLEIIEHQTTMVRLGESVDESGEISRDKLDTAVDTVRKYQELAQQHGAEQILAIATEAIREARNSQDFLDMIKRETGIEVQIISGSAEAALDYDGATYSPDTPPDAGVLDVGGGSSEIVTAQNRHITWLTSVPIGTGVIHDRYLPSDPPTHEETEAARSYLARYMPTIRIPEPPSALIVTGSSASSLLKLAQRAFKLDERYDRMADEDLTRCVGLLSALPAEEIAQRFEQPLERARILAAGALIIQTVMRYMHLSEIRVSSHGVREGVLLAYTSYGEHWLDEINSIASRRGTSPTNQHDDEMQEKQQQPFAEFGREILSTYAKKFLKWPDAIRKQEDSEDVHKMRVASRRLREALEACESCAKPKPFRKVNRGVKRLADRLGTVRDTDVMIAGLRTYQQSVPVEERAGVQWLIDRLDCYHQQEEQALERELQALDENALRQQIDSCIPKGAAH
jgi:exopolyphosphatase / guanosine-5'-triphosphate,3'-diphosphate pyrophosphatase